MPIYYNSEERRFVCTFFSARIYSLKKFINYYNVSSGNAKALKNARRNFFYLVYQ